MSDSMQLLSFENLAKRVLFRYAFSFADFIPMDTETVPVEAQQRFHAFCRALVNGIADDPSILGLSTEQPDDWLQPHGIMKMKPDLYKVRNDCQKAFVDLFTFLFLVGLRSEQLNGQLVVSASDFSKVTPKMLSIYQNVFTRYDLRMENTGGMLLFSFGEDSEAVSAWKLIAKKCSDFPYSPKKQLLCFALWLHNEDWRYFANRLQSLLNLDDGFFEYIDQKYRERGYSPSIGADEYSTDITYAKEVGGLSIQYSTLLPTVRFVNTNTIGIKATLEHAADLDDDVICQLVKFCKKCNGCMICTKGGKNKQFTVTVHNDGTSHGICPEFVQMEWYNSDISREKIDFLLELNELQEKFGKKKK